MSAVPPASSRRAPGDRTLRSSSASSACRSFFTRTAVWAGALQGRWEQGGREAGRAGQGSTHECCVPRQDCTCACTCRKRTAVAPALCCPCTRPLPCPPDAQPAVHLHVAAVVRHRQRAPKQQDGGGAGGGAVSDEGAAGADLRGGAVCRTGDERAIVSAVQQEPGAGRRSRPQRWRRGGADTAVPWTTFSRNMRYGRWYCCASRGWQMLLGWIATSPPPSCHPGRLPAHQGQAQWPESASGRGKNATATAAAQHVKTCPARASGKCA